MGLLERIHDKTAKVVIIGGGYVGLPLAVEIAKAGFETYVFDKDTKKVNAISRRESYISDVPELPKSLRATNDPGVLENADVVVICVPTPLNKTKDPDNSFILKVAEALTMVAYRRSVSSRASEAFHQQLVILESTTFPGFTREVLLPELSEAMTLDESLFLAFSPERVDPGNKIYGIKNTPRIVGGVSAKSTELAQRFYAKFVESVYGVGSSDAAEMTKLLENTYRAVNIGLVNEIAIMCGHLGLDTQEVLDAAATKPFGFQRFTPGPGIGGHCIPIDPLYLSWKLKTLKYNARFIALADEVNSAMPAHVVEMVTAALNDRERSVRGSNILICGVAYKKNVSDIRESPALDIIELLRERGASVYYRDSHVAKLTMAGLPVPYDDPWNVGYHAAVVVTDHSDVDYALLVERTPVVIDTRGVCPRGPKVVSL